jgi:hypothetical protein
MSLRPSSPKPGRGLQAGMARIALLGAVAIALSGCLDLDDDPEHVLVVVDEVPPAIPSGLVSVTGDGQVDLVWNPCLEPDFAEYRVYWSSTATGPYEPMASTRAPRYTDYDVDNGVTYFYAVTAVDHTGNESDLSPEMVHDTPRPEGVDLVLYDAAGPSWELSGYEFDRYLRRPFSAPDTDIYFTLIGGRPAMVAGDHALDDLDWAPPAGWTGEDRVTLILGHSYYVWTRDDHYAKFRVTAIDHALGRVIVDWAYQIDGSNPELRGGR